MNSVYFLNIIGHGMIWNPGHNILTLLDILQILLSPQV